MNSISFEEATKVLNRVRTDAFLQAHNGDELRWNVVRGFYYDKNWDIVNDIVGWFNKHTDFGVVSQLPRKRTVLGVRHLSDGTPFTKYTSYMDDPLLLYPHQLDTINNMHYSSDELQSIILNANQLYDFLRVNGALDEFVEEYDGRPFRTYDQYLHTVIEVVQESYNKLMED